MPAFDAENDDSAEAFVPGEIYESEIEDEESATQCVGCGGALEDGECIDPFCPENPDNVLDEDEESLDADD